MGEGQLTDQFQLIAEALRRAGSNGAASFNSVYHPGDGDLEAGLRLVVDRFTSLFG